MNTINRPGSKRYEAKRILESKSLHVRQFKKCDVWNSIYEFDWLSRFDFCTTFNVQHSIRILSFSTLLAKKSCTTHEAIYHLNRPSLSERRMSHISFDLNENRQNENEVKIKINFHSVSAFSQSIDYRLSCHLLCCLPKDDSNEVKVNF